MTMDVCLNTSAQTYASPLPPGMIGGWLYREIFGIIFVTGPPSGPNVRSLPVSLLTAWPAVNGDPVHRASPEGSGWEPGEGQKALAVLADSRPKPR